MLAALLALQMPAGLLLKLAPLPDTIQVNQLEGTLWQGSVRQIGFNNGLVTENVNWKWEPDALRQATLAWHVTADNGSHLLIKLNHTGWQLAILQASYPIQPLTELHPHLKRLALSGLVQINQQIINARSDNISVTLADVRSQLSGDAPLGTYSLVLQPSTGQITLNTVTGALNLSGQGQLNPKGHGSLSIAAHSSTPEVARLLENLGSTTADNKKSITMQF